MREHQIEQGALYLITADRFQSGAGPSMLDDPKRTLKIPHGIAPSEFLIYAKQVIEPAHGNIVGSVLETTEFANMNPFAGFFHLPPRPI